MKTIHYLYLSIVSFFLFFFLSIFIVNGNTIFCDLPIYEGLKNLSMDSFFLKITHFGEAKILIPILIFFFFWIKNKTNWKFFASLMLLEVGTNTVLKLFFARPRPSIEQMIYEKGYSFPSGHMMASTMFYGLCIYFLWQSKYPKIWKWLGTFFFSFLIISVGMSRVYLGVHFFSDILGGLFCSLFLLFFGIFFFESMNKNCVKKE